MREVLVTGMGLVTPARPLKGLQEFWGALCSGEDSVRMSSPPLLDVEHEWPMARIDLEAAGISISAEEKLPFIAGKALDMALEDAGLRPRPDIPVGLCVGTVLGNILLKEKLMMGAAAGALGDGKSPSLSAVASDIHSGYGFKGPCITVSTACASGTDALGIAARKIMSGRAELMVAGGVEVLSDLAVVGFHVLQALTKDKVRPFDKGRSGLALGEGAAFVVLESGESAARRAVRPYAKVAGYASRADATHLTGPHREGRGLADAILAALSAARLGPGDIEYINAHGTGTRYNDLSETKAIKRALGEAAYGVPVSSTKSMLGHSFGSAGVIEAICCLLAIGSGVIPPTINFVERDPECDLDYVPNNSRKKEVTTAMSLSAGFGGQNSVIIFRKI